MGLHETIIKGYGIIVDDLELMESEVAIFYLKNKREDLIEKDLVKNKKSDEEINDFKIFVEKLGKNIIQCFEKETILYEIFKDDDLVLVSSDYEKVFLMENARMMWEYPENIRNLSRECFEEMFVEKIANFFNEDVNYLLDIMDYIETISME